MRPLHLLLICTLLLVWSAVAEEPACTLRMSAETDFPPHLIKQNDNWTGLSVELMQRLADEAGIPFTTNHVGSMFGFFFTSEKKVTNFKQVMACDIPRFNAFFHGMLARGVYLAPASYEAGFMSGAHTEQDIQATLTIAAEVFATLK